jgi:serine/threonine protein kinase/Flp pilus assembly protein TadD
MATTELVDPEHESRLNNVLAAYFDAVEAGQPADCETLLARYPDLAAELRNFFAEQDQVHGLASPLRLLLQPGQAATPPEQLTRQEGKNDSPTFAAPTELGDFRIVREVSRGGMGIVYEAEQVSLGRRVALKLLPFAATLDPKQLLRFQNEARAAAQLHHTNIVPVYYGGCEKGIAFYAMQFIDGQSVAGMIAGLRARAGGQDSAERNAPEPVREATADAASGRVIAPSGPAAMPETARAGIFSTAPSTKNVAYFRLVAQVGIQAAEALDYAHQAGIVHRDVKPANLLVDSRGSLWVTDFGLAQVQGDARLTITGDLVGTLRYMSPEQALAKRVVVDHRTDVYSLGATLYELLTLAPAHSGADIQEVLRQIAFEEPRLPRRVNRAIPTELETIVLKAMQKNAADRFATAQELADDLHRYLRDETIRARRATLVQRLRKWARRHKGVLAAAAVVLVMALLLGGAAGLREVQKRARAEGEAQAALEEATELRQQAKWHEALSAVRRARGVLAGVWADQALRRQVEEPDRDLQMALLLQEARLCGAAVKDGHFDFEETSAAYAEAFAWYGLDVDQLDAGQAAECIRSRTIRLELAAALDTWAFCRKSLKKDCRHLLAVARVADPDLWRNRLRDALEQNDARALEELAASARGDELPPATVVLLAKMAQGTAAAEQAVEVLRRAQRHRPDDFWLNHDLGSCLQALRPRRSEEAIRYYSVAVGLRPESPGAHNNLGNALNDKGQLDEAIAEYREAIRLKKDYAEAHYNLGNAMLAEGRRDAAISCYRQAIGLKKDFALAHNNLGNVLAKQGKLDEAIACYRQAIKIDPKDATAYSNLGNALYEESKLDEAVACYRQAIKINPKHANAHNNLGVALARQGKLPAVLKGEYKPRSSEEWLGFAELSGMMQMHHAAARLYVEAFTADPKMADILATDNRYNAACAAALAGCGQGEDAAKLDDTERGRLRRQALDWLRADLAAYGRLLAKGPDKARPAIRQRMQHWQQNADFAGVRGAAALAKLPEAERPAWHKLWADVADTLTRTQGKTVPAKKPDSK